MGPDPTLVMADVLMRVVLLNVIQYSIQAICMLIAALLFVRIMDGSGK
jgi:hypothetical protein